MIKGDKKPILLFILSLAIFAYAIVRRLGVELPDDAAFFLRYAENAAQGHFWVWNIGESPVWGASAPLFPLLLILPIKLGAPPVASIIWTSVGLSSIALAVTTILISRRFGYLAACSFVVLAALDTPTMFFAGSGLETPLTFALLAFALFVLIEKRGQWAAGFAMGLLAVHKMDLIPVSAALLMAYVILIRRIPVRSILIAAVLSAVWYGFAWTYFGAPVPNSFLTKALHQNDFVNIIDWRWFGSTVYYRFDHWVLSVLALIGLVRARNNAAPLLTFMLGLLLVHLAAYTVKHPFEPYDWYCMPSLYVLLILAGVGVANLGDVAQKLAGGKGLVGVLAVCLLLAVVVRSEIEFQRADAKSRQNWLAYVEHDRAEAGRWVNENTPQSFRVLTAWGNPAYFSRRYVYDLSFLNRRYESGDLIKKYHPEILIFQNSEQSTPLTPDQYGSDYTAIRIFDSAFGSGEGNYFFTVYARKDVLPQIHGVVFPLKTSCVSTQDCHRYSPLEAEKPSAQRPADLPVDSVSSEYCHLDELNHEPFLANEMMSRQNTFEFSGWALNGSEKSLPTVLFVKFSGAAGTFYAPARSRYYRPDVPAVLRLPSSLENAGFKTKLDLSNLPVGDYNISILVGARAQTQECAAQPIHLSQ
ncbi:glycosyltransferase family 87 protein [Paraburkholderia fungorum]|uniref:glycosyltransferase family 87 protein n=1 Tax=Paraburkholderia fungorum TaxID=134537 RepID=UPI00402BACF6